MAPGKIEVEIVLTDNSQELIDRIDELALLVPESCAYEATIIFDRIRALIEDSLRGVNAS